MAQKLTQHLPD